MLPQIDLRIDATSPNQVRSLLSQLSGRAQIGVVDALEIEPGRIIMRAYADRFNFTILGSEGRISIFENLGPQAVRTWYQEPAEEVQGILNSLLGNFGEHEPEVERLAYLYTESSWFIPRHPPPVYLPRLKRRAYQTPKGQIVIFHSKQSDTAAGQTLEYILEIEGRFWRCSYELRVNGSDKIEVLAHEKAHAIEAVGF